jgi:hypothetical protein
MNSFRTHPDIPDNLSPMNFLYLHINCIQFTYFFLYSINVFQITLMYLMKRGVASMRHGLMSILLCLMFIGCHKTPSVQIEGETFIDPGSGKAFLLYPATYTKAPDLPSPLITKEGREILTAITKDKSYALIDVTFENGMPCDIRQGLLGKGRQFEADGQDFPTLKETGLHSVEELNRVRSITGKSISQITEDGRPEQFSGIGFMAADEDIVSVLRGDNELVRSLGLTHPQLARPLFHVWNLLLTEMQLGNWVRFWDGFPYFLYNGRKVYIQAFGTKGYQHSLFNDEIIGSTDITLSRSMDSQELSFLNTRYAGLDASEMDVLIEKLSRMHTGEMEPYYIMRYGFYEGHTIYRVDPIAIAFIFGLLSLEEIDLELNGEIFTTLTSHYTQ